LVSPLAVGGHDARSRERCATSRAKISPSVLTTRPPSRAASSTAVSASDRSSICHRGGPSPATLDNRGIAAGREGPPMRTSPPFSPPLKSAERNPQKGAADDVGAEDQHPDQQSRFHVSGPSGGARSAAGPNTRDWLNVRAWLGPPTGLSQSNPSRFNLDAGSYCPRVFRGDGGPASPRRLQPLAKFFHGALAQKIGITLAGLGKFDDLIGNNSIGETVRKS
jgi:hypothetical protein